MQRGAIADWLSGAVPQAVFRLIRRTCYPLLLMGLVLAVAAWSLRAVWPFTIDDAGISYAYAKHIAEGAGPVAVVGGPWVEGYSNALWVFLLLPLQLLGLSLPVAAKWLGVALLAATAALGAGLLALADERPWRAMGAIDAGLALALACSVEVVIWTVAGLENALFGALLLAVSWLYAARGATRVHAAVEGLGAFALCITRPEGPLYVLPWLFGSALRCWRGPGRRQSLWAIAWWLGPLLLYHALHYAVFRELVPNTYYAKPQSKDPGQGYTYLEQNLSASGLIYAAPLALLGLLGKAAPRWLLAASVACGSLFIIYSGGDWMPHGRFMALFAPSLLVLAAIGVSTLARLGASLSRGRLPRELWALALTSLLLFAWWSHQAPRLRALAKRPWCHFCERVADTEWIKRTSSRAGFAHTSLLTHDFGGPSWLSDRRLYAIDFLGLCDPTVSRLRHAFNARGGAFGRDFRFYQYFMHEQPEPPSWLVLPPNFWRGFDRSPEYRLGYFRLDPQKLRHTRRDSFFGLHRAELVDYFPPVPPAGFRALSEGLELVGVQYTRSLEAGAEARVQPLAKVHAVVSLLRRSRWSGDEQIALRISSSSESAFSQALRIAGGIAGVAAQLTAADPLSLEFDVSVPAAPASTYRVEMGLRSAPSGQAQGPGAYRFFELGELQAGAVLPPYERALPRFPAALPAPTAPELLRLRPAVSMAIDRLRRSGKQEHDSDLVRELISLGRQSEATGQLDQAYLAYVWATQVDRRAWEDLTETLLRVRQTSMDGAFASELELLRHFYSEGKPDALARLVAFYLASARPLEAQYFLRFWPPDAPDAALRESLLAAARAELDQPSTLTGAARAELLQRVVRDPIAGGSDFETPALDGWQGDVGIFRSGAGPSLAGLQALRGQHGQGSLSSLGRGESGQGALLSPAFQLQGRWLSLLVSGGSQKRRVGVELIVDGKRARGTAGNDSDFMFMTFWDVSEHAGKPARLRVYDQSATSHVSLDRVLLWQ